MAHQINPGLADELHAYGASDADKCFNCGNCSAVCVHSEAPHILPRRPMHAFQLGLEDKLKGSLEPWMCYYCGECSEQCPKEAEPGETMMSMRRWLTSKYDFSGLSGLFYRSPAWEIIAIVLAAILTGIGFVLFGVLHGGSINVQSRLGRGTVFTVLLPIVHEEPAQPAAKLHAEAIESAEG
jgi:Fe-S oxidoreductase